MIDSKKYRIGLRTIKTGIAVGLSLYIANLLNLKSPIFVGIGAIMSMQSSVSESFITGKHRMIGTFVGAGIGLLFSYFLPSNYLFICLGTIIVIYIHNLLGWNKSLTISAIVYLAIILNTENSRIPYAANRLLDTFIGISVAVIINYFIATPNVKKIFLERKMHIIKTCKTLVYNLIKNKNEISFNDFSKELISLDSTFSLYKQDLDMNVAKSHINNTSINILSMLDYIYNDLKIILKFDRRPILDERNAALFVEIYAENFIPINRDIDELDIVYNYHINNILNNIINIDNLLIEKSGS